MNIRYASLLLAFFLSAIQLFAQTEELEVIRSTALPWGSPVQNIFVDADNTKWVANTRTVKKVLGPRTAVPIAIDPGQQALFQYPGGNADIRWTTEGLKAAIGDIIDEDNFITAAFYDEINGDIWLGTTLTGAFQLKQQNGALQFIAQWSMDNTRLRSNYVNDIKRGPKGRMWIATEDGVLVGKNGNWDIIERGLIVEAIAIGGSDVWLMGDGLVGKVDRRDKWALIDIPTDKVEREIVDIAVDGMGRLWLASAIISCYDPEQETYQVFGGAEEYTSEFANRLVVDMDGAVWIGTEDKGLYVIQKGSSLIAAVEIEQTVRCGGNGKDGALLAQVSGGTPPYQYAWSTGASGERVTDLPPGEYQLTITDSKGKSRSVAAQVPDERLSATAKLISGVTAEGLTDGQAEVRAEGGQRPYTFTWDNGESSGIATQLSAGLHLVTVTDSKGCEQVGQVEVPDKLAPLAASIEEVNSIQCRGNKSATLLAQASGGEAPYQYKWSFGGAASSQITDLPSGNYTVTITDAEGNIAQADYLIEEPAALSVRTEIIAMPKLGQKDGRAIVEVSGGKPPYSYRWDNGETLDEATQLGAGLHEVV
ncbi:MAG TPA: SprB repeat-containing protein, partial [Phaeodactylibacter sp.]|nr:SprB repeat-containing protein [Phaeodactylibacter sp.]